MTTYTTATENTEYIMGMPVIVNLRKMNKKLKKENKHLKQFVNILTNNSEIRSNVSHNESPKKNTDVLSTNDIMVNVIKRIVENSSDDTIVLGMIKSIIFDKSDDIFTKMVDKSTSAADTLPEVITTQDIVDEEVESVLVSDEEEAVPVGEVESVLVSDDEEEEVPVGEVESVPVSDDEEEVPDDEEEEEVLITDDEGEEEEEEEEDEEEEEEYVEGEVEGEDEEYVEVECDYEPEVDYEYEPEVEVEVEVGVEGEVEEEEMEMFEITVNGKTYCTDDLEYGTIYEILPDGDVGDQVGEYKKKRPYITKKG